MKIDTALHSGSSLFSGSSRDGPHFFALDATPVRTVQEQPPKLIFFSVLNHDDYYKINKNSTFL
jgi:hypothetical protein